MLCNPGQARQRRGCALQCRNPHLHTLVGHELQVARHRAVAQQDDLQRPPGMRQCEQEGCNSVSKRADDDMGASATTGLAPGQRRTSVGNLAAHDNASAARTFQEGVSG